LVNKSAGRPQVFQRAQAKRPLVFFFDEITLKLFLYYTPYNLIIQTIINHYKTLSSFNFKMLKFYIIAGKVPASQIPVGFARTRYPGCFGTASSWSRGLP
jgi:hypothetical protein